MPRHDRDAQRVGVIGLGLIGGSIARALSGIRQVVAYDVDADTRMRAQAVGVRVVESSIDVVRQSDLIVVAVPMPQASAAFQQLSEDMISSQSFPLVTDVASVKLPIGLSAIGILPPQSTFVGSHPMAGKEMPGFAASEPELFGDAAWPVMVESRATLRSVMDVCALVLDCGARPIPMTAGDHDRIVASISHLPHVLATTLLAVATSSSDAGLNMRLAAGSFRDGTRVATHNAELVGSMCELNKTHVLDSIDATIAELASFRDFVATASTATAIAERVDVGAAQRLKIVNGEWLAQEVVFALDDNQSWRSVLLELGSVGGHIGGLQESRNQLRLTLCVPRVS